MDAVYCRLDELEKRTKHLENLLKQSESALADAIRNQPKKISKDDIVVVTKDTKYNIKGKLGVVTIITTSEIDPTIYTVKLSSGTSILLNFDDIGPVTEEQKTEWKKEKHAHSFAVGQIVVDNQRHLVGRIIQIDEKNGVSIQCVFQTPDGQQFDQKFSNIVLADALNAAWYKGECVTIFKEKIDSLFEIMSDDEKKDARQKLLGESTEIVKETKNVFFVDDVVIISQPGHYFNNVGKVIRVSTEQCTVELVDGVCITFSMMFLRHAPKIWWKNDDFFDSALKTLNRLQKVAWMAKMCESLKEE